MNDMELAEEIERQLTPFFSRPLSKVPSPAPGIVSKSIELPVTEWREIIAALRRADLAQTEIKGHMRVEDDLRAELREANEAAIRWYRAASPYAAPVALREALDRLKDHA